MRRRKEIEETQKQLPGNFNVQYEIVVKAMEWKEP